MIKAINRLHEKLLVEQKRWMDEALVDPQSPLDSSHRDFSSRVASAKNHDRKLRVLDDLLGRISDDVLADYGRVVDCVSLPAHQDAKPKTSALGSMRWTMQLLPEQEQQQPAKKHRVSSKRP